jgi:hypothetical protein
MDVVDDGEAFCFEGAGADGFHSNSLDMTMVILPWSRVVIGRQCERPAARLGMRALITG